MSDETSSPANRQGAGKWLRIAGIVLQVLVAGLMLFAGFGKVFGTPPPEVLEALTKYGLKGQVQLIGLGEMTSAILMLAPRVSPLGVLLTSSFWGGAICLHMAHGESYLFQSGLLLVTWLAAHLRGSVTLWK